jgi:hypothetical protein
MMRPGACLAVLLGAAAAAQAQDLAPLSLDEASGVITFGATPAKLDQYPQLKGSIEFAIVMPKGKEYESCLVAPLDPLQLHELVKKIGVQPGRPAGEKDPATGGQVRIWVEWKDGDKDRKEPLEAFILDTDAGKPMADVRWIFQGSKSGFDPETESMQLLVKSTRNLIGLYQGEGTPLFTNPQGPMTGHKYKANKDLLPKPGTPMKVGIQAVK